MFSLTNINNLFDENSSDSIGFIRVTNSSGYIRMGYLKQPFNPVGGNWIENGNVGNNESFNTTFTSSDNNIRKKYGCKVENSNGDKGIYIEPTSIDDDLTLFIGLKN